MITITTKDGATIIVVSQDHTDEEDEIIKKARSIANRGWKSSSSTKTNKWQSSTKETVVPKAPASLAEEIHKTIDDVKKANADSAENNTDGNDDYPF